MTTGNNRKVIELIRVSTEMQAGADREGLNSQRDQNRRTAQHNGLTIVKSFEIIDVSGANTLHCPEMLDLLRWIERPEIEGVVCAMFSRLIRSQNNRDLATVLDQMRDTNTKLYMPDGVTDLTTEDGMLIGTIKGALAGMELRSVVANMWRGKEAKRRRGGFVGNKNNLPFGVSYVKGRGWKYEPEAERVRQAFEAFAAGEVCYNTLGRRFDFSPFTLRVLLRNRLYAGWREYTMRRDPRPGARRMKANGRQASRPKIKRTGLEVIPPQRIEWDGQPVEPLISDELFQTVQRMIEQKAANHWRATGIVHQQHYAYAGFLFCGKCGRRLYGEGFPRRYYTCWGGRAPGKPCERRRQRRDDIEALVDDLLGLHFSSSQFRDNLLGAYMNANRGVTGEQSKARLEQSRRDLTKRKVRVLDNYEAGHYDATDRDAKLAAIAKELQTIEASLAQITKVDFVTPERLAAWLAPFKRWKALTRPDRRKLLVTLMPEVHITDYQITGLKLAALPGADITTPLTTRGSARVGRISPTCGGYDAYTPSASSIFLPIPAGTLPTIRVTTDGRARKEART